MFRLLSTISGLAFAALSLTFLSLAPAHAIDFYDNLELTLDTDYINVISGDRAVYSGTLKNIGTGSVLFNSISWQGLANYVSLADSLVYDTNSQLRILGPDQTYTGDLFYVDTAKGLSGEPLSLPTGLYGPFNVQIAGTEPESASYVYLSQYVPVSFMAFNIVPEPGVTTLAVTLLSGIGLLARRRVK